MNPHELKEFIRGELDGQEIANWHHTSTHNVYQFLVEPRIIMLMNVLGQINQYWLVWDEQPDDPKNGYRVVYAEQDDMFGLATKSTVDDAHLGYLVGLYGSFVDVLENM